MFSTVLLNGDSANGFENIEMMGDGWLPQPNCAGQGRHSCSTWLLTEQANKLVSTLDPNHLEAISAKFFFGHS